MQVLSMALFCVSIVVSEGTKEEFIGGVIGAASTGLNFAKQTGLLGGSASDKEGCFACELVWR